MSGGRARDLLIVGGGPVGLGLAIAARRRGLAVTVLERGRAPIDKACGEGIMPDGVACLGALAVPLAVEARRPFFGIRFVDGERRVEGRFPRAAQGWGVRRLELHAAMVEAAAASGAELRWGEEVAGLAGGDGGAEPAVRTARGERLDARFLVGADGLSSPLRAWSGLAAEPRAPRTGQRRFGVRRHYEIEPWSDLVEVHFSGEAFGERSGAGSAGVEAYVTPLAGREVGVAMLWDAASGPASFDLLLARFPALAARLAGAGVSSRDRGLGPLEQRAKAVVRGRLALVGDASGYIDAITGEGISVGLRQALALAEAAAAGDLERYRAVHRRIVRLPNAIVRLTMALERRADRRGRVLACLERDPDLFDRLLGVHGGLLPPRRIGWGGFARLASAWVGRT